MMTGTEVLSRERVCLYHDKKWRSQFQHLVNQVRGDIIPVRYLGQFQCLVCVCKPGKMDRKPENFKQVLDEFDNVKFPKKSVSEIMEVITKSDLWDVGNPDLRCQSVERLVFLLHCAVKGDFTIMKREKSPKTPQENPMTKADITIEAADFSPAYLGLMIGKKGKNIDCVQKKYHCKVIFHTSRGIGVSFGKFSATVDYPVDKPNTLMDVSQCLEKTANRIISERKFHAQRIQAFVKRRLENAHDRSTNRNANICNTKEANTRMFERHSIANRKFATKQEHVSKLEGSHCLNCLADYTTSLFKEARCTHHPGYKVKVTNSGDGKKKKDVYQWTCCDMECVKSYTMADDHADSGCSVGIHNWRPERRQQKGEAKPKNKVFATHMN